MLILNYNNWQEIKHIVVFFLQDFCTAVNVFASRHKNVISPGLTVLFHIHKIILKNNNQTRKSHSLYGNYTENTREILTNDFRNSFKCGGFVQS